MREPERDFGRLQDIIQAANRIISFTEGHSIEDLSMDKLRYFAVVKNVEIIGEASYMLSSVFKEAHSDIPWNDIIRMRHVLVHGYATILPELLWHTALEDVPQLKKQIDAILNPSVFLDLVRSSRNQLTEKEYLKISKKVEEEIADEQGKRQEQWEAARLFRSGRGLANGFAPQSTERLKNLLLHILEQMGETFQTKMNKVLFYIDFLSYRERGMAISGLAYQAMEFGPVPQRWDRVYSAFDDVEQMEKLAKGQECLSLLANGTADMSGFSAGEMAIIDHVCKTMKTMTSRAASQMSHNEPMWAAHVQKQELIPFSEAFSLVGM